MRNMTGTKFDNICENLVNRIKAEPQFRANKGYCIAFVKSCDSMGRSVHTKNKYLDKVRYISDVVPNKDFKKWTRKDVEAVFTKLRTHTKSWTIESYKAFFKSFWRYINGIASNEPSPKCVKWLQAETPSNGIEKEDLLTRDEIQRMWDSTKNIEWKALIAVLCSGTRPNECLTITLGNIHDNGEILKIYVRAKPVKGKKESTRAIYPGFFMKGQGHKDIIRQWANAHPKKSDKSARLFDGMTYSNMRMITERLAERAGIMQTNGKGKYLGGKKIFPYLYRHSFGTWAYSKHNSAYARRLMGHSPGSKMEGVYCHLAEEDLEDMLLGKVEQGQDENIEKVENQTQEFIRIGKAIRRLAELHPDVISDVDVGNLQKIVGGG